MTRVPDPLLSGSARADRLHYATGELLGADDFRAEQTYHRRQLALATLHLNGSGSVAGLRVFHRHRPGSSGGADEVMLQVEPGLAVDRAGRLIEVAREACLRLRRWYGFIAARPPGSADLNAGHLRGAWRADGSAVGGAVVADVFLAFHPCPRGYTPAFASGPFDALDASQPSRVRDAYELSLVLRSEADDDLPVASDPWSDITGDTLEERVASARRASLTLWNRLAEPAPENPPGTDPTALLLARLRLPAQQNADVRRAPDPEWSAGAWTDEETNVNNDVRAVLLPPAAVRRLIVAP